MRNRNKGFTLVEIIISITIGSVVLALMGTMILTSSNFMSNTTNSDMDKRCVDSCMEFIRDQIEYSTDVRIIENKGLDNYPVEGEDNWHCFYIKNHILYRDDSPVFDKSFYNNKKLEILVKDDYKNNMRVDFTYHLNDNDGEKAYGNRDTVVFLNISEKNKPDGGLYVSSDVSLDSSKDNYAVYYKKSLKTNNSSNTPSGDNDNNENTGTVANQLKLINVYNNRDAFELIDEKVGKYIYRYDYVFYDGYYWQLLEQSNFYAFDGRNGRELPDNCCKFKRISAEFTYKSAYEVGDVVIYNNEYYYCTTNYINYGAPEYYTPCDGSWRGNTFWRKAKESEYLNKDGAAHIDANRCNIEKNNQTIMKKFQNIDFSIVPEFDSKENASIPCVSDPLNPTQGDIYKITEIDSNTNQKRIRYFIKIFDNGSLPGQSNDGKVGWQEISFEFKKNSAYVKGDIVYQSHTFNGNENYNSAASGYLKALYNVDSVKNITKDIQYSDNDTESRWKFINI